MSRLVVLACAAALLLASAALAQPIVQAPLLNRVAAIGDSGLSATLPVAVAGFFGFTTVYNTTGATNYYQLVATTLNVSASLANQTTAFSFNLPWQPTSLFMATWERVGVICNDTVLFYGANETTVWFVGSVTNTSLRFDINNPGASGNGAQFILPAIGPMGEVIIGTQNLNGIVDSSMLYTINATTAAVINSVALPYQRANFRPMWDPTTPERIYVMVRPYTGSSYNRILQFTIATLASSGNDTVTSESGLTLQFNVYAGVIALVSYSDYWYFFHAGNNTPIVQGSTSCYGGVNFAPAMVAGRWYLSCASYINVFDNVTLARLTTPALTLSGSSYFTAADVDGWMASSVVAVCSGSDVYVINGTVPALSKLMTVPSVNGNTLNPTAAIFAFNTSVLQVSYSGSTSGGVVAINITTGEIIGQITNINPVGWSLWLDHVGLDVVAGGSTGGVNTVLGAYNTWFNRSMAGYYVNATGSSSNSYSNAFVVNGTVGFYVSYNTITKFNVTTGALIVSWPNPSSSSWTTTYGPVIVANFVCYNSYSPSNTYCFDGMSGAVTTLSTCTPNTAMPFVVVGNMLAVRCSGDDLYTWVAGATTAISVTGYTRNAAVNGTTAFVSSSSYGFVGYTVPLTSTSTTKFQLPSSTYVFSPPVAVAENFAFLSGTLSGSTYVYALTVYSSTGSKIGSITIPGMTSASAMFAKAGGQFGTMGWVYAYNGTYLAGVNLNTMNLVFQVKADIDYTSSQGTPFFTSQGGMCFYGASYNRFYMISAFSGAAAWWAPVSSSLYSQMPVEANGAIYYNNGYNVVAADIFSGQTRAAVGYGNSQINGFSAWTVPGTNYTTITATTANNAIVGTTAYVDPSVGFFAGGGGSGSGNGEGEKSKAWIAAIVVGVIVIAVVIVVIKKKSAGTGQAATGQDYVAMNSQQV